MLRIHILEDLDKGNIIIGVTFFKSSILRLARRILRHTDHTFVYTNWYWGRKTEEIIINKETIKTM